MRNFSVRNNITINNGLTLLWKEVIKLSRLFIVIQNKLFTRRDRTLDLFITLLIIFQ